MTTNGTDTPQASGLAGGARQVRDGAGRLGSRIHDWWVGAPWWQRWAAYLLTVLGAALLPSQGVASVMSPHTDWTTILFHPIGTFILLAIGLNIVVGHAGLLDLGYVAFFAVGGYTLAYLGTEHGWSFWPTLAVGIGITAVSGLILGTPTLRVRGDYLAIVTLGFGEIVRITANNIDEIGGARGITNIPHPPPMLGTEFLLDPKPYYYLILVMIVLAIVLSRRLERSRVGRAWSAMREDEDAAELMGVPTFRFKLLAFAIGAIIGGLAGGVWAGKVIFIQPNNFLFILSATILVAVVLGGAGNVPGVILGAFLVAWLPERFRGVEEYRVLIFGGALVLMMALRPEGLLPSRRRRAELAEGTGSMGSMGAEVAGPGRAGAAGGGGQ